MTAQFRSFAEIFRQTHEPEPVSIPPISPLITEVPEPTIRARIDEDRLFAARLCERVDEALERLLENLACEVLGRELLLAPVDIDAVARRLLKSFGIERARWSVSGDELTLACEGGTIDASLGRRLRVAIDRAL